MNRRQRLFLKGASAITVEWLLIIALSLFSNGNLQAQSVDMLTLYIPEAPVAGDELTVHLSVNKPVEPYFFSTEVLYDTSVVSFTGIDTGELMAGGIQIADLIEPGRIGASVSRTEEISEAQAGSLMTLRFRVSGRAPGGESVMEFTAMELIESNETEIPVTETAVDTFFVAPSISELELLLPESSVTTEGDILLVKGRVYVNGVTDVEADVQKSIELWAGVHGENSNPAEWSESAWSKLSFSDQGVDGSHLYQGQIGYQLDPGTRYIALRSRFEDGVFLYGGVYPDSSPGFWDGDVIRSSEWTVTDTPAFRYTVAGWDFDGESMFAARGIPGNRGREFYLVGATLSGFSQGADGQAASSRNWSGGDNGSAYWLAHVHTLGLGNIQVSSEQYGSGSGPRDMQLQAGTDGKNWEDVAGGDITVETNWSGGVLQSVALPEKFENLPDLFLRWVLKSDIRVEGKVDNTKSISSQGTSRIDNVMVTGENLYPTDIDVWPGDADNNGVVDESDVLVLGTNWLSAGPPPVFNTTSWMERRVEEWLPGQATFADTDGNGLVDHLDLKVIGLNFGESRSSGRVPPSDEEMVRYDVGPLKKGTPIYLEVVAEKEVYLSGLSYRVVLDGAGRDDVDINTILPAEWAGDWQKDQKVLDFDWRNAANGERAGAFIHKGPTAEKPATNLLIFRLTSRTSGLKSVGLLLKSLVITNNTGNRSAVSLVRLSETDPVKIGEEEKKGEQEKKTVLLQNFPNPANGVTKIGFWLPETADVKMELYDLAGRLVRVPTDGRLTAGYHEFSLDTGSLASGVYLYRLLIDGESMVKKMMVVH